MSQNGSPDYQPGLTAGLVEHCLALTYSGLPHDVCLVGRTCLVDWLACALAGANEPAVRIAAELVQGEGGHCFATVIGRGWRTGLLQAALVNGAASHTLDYDDVNLVVPGHTSSVLVPPLFALAEHHGAKMGEFIAALVAGHEFACCVGALIGPAHYADGFHATATMGTLGASVACSHLLGLNSAQTCYAVGLAATQASGLKATFGSMTKSVQVGLAAQAGLRAALLARSGLTSRADVLECKQGFLQLYGSGPDSEEEQIPPPGKFHIRENLFKFHASCLSTHSTVEAIAVLRREHDLDASSVRAIRVKVGEGCSMCNILEPRTGLEAKFSLRAAAAFSLLGFDTGKLGTWSRVTDSAVRKVLDRVTVELIPGMGLTRSTVTVVCWDGTEWTLSFDCGDPIEDKAAQLRRITEKFRATVTPALGEHRTDELAAALSELRPDDSLAPLITLCRGPYSAKGENS